MKIILLILLWSSITGKINSTCMDLEDGDAELKYTTSGKSCSMKAQLVATCDGNTVLKDANITLKSVCCTPQGSSTPATDIATTMTIQKTEIITQPCECQVTGSVASIGLGVVVGLLVALLAVVTTGWMWTCWTMRRQARILTNFRNTSNPSYGGDQLTLQNHPLPTPIPTYETIPPLTNFMDGIKLDLGEPKEERYDAGNNREEAYQKLNRAQRDNIKRENKDQTHKSGDKEGYQGKKRVTEPSSGTGLQEIQHSHSNTSTEVLLESALPSEEGQSVNSVDISKASQENEIMNSSVKNDKELDGTTSEQNHDQTEMREKEQNLPQKRAAPRDYELVIPSK